jgi:hypothetical protein
MNKSRISGEGEELVKLFFGGDEELSNLATQHMHNFSPPMHSA